MIENGRGCSGPEKTGTEQGSFQRLTEIVAALRGDHGCPWDRAQTFDSLKICMVNEMTEALAAIDRYGAGEGAENLCEELGDVLLQVVFLAQIAREEGLFTIEDVIEGVSRKMVRRHPHVFREDGGETAASVPGRWEAIKAEEKKNSTPGQRKREKEAFAEAALWVKEHL